MRKTLWTILTTIVLSLPFMAQEPLDRDRLGMAIEYFQSGKYHEALLIFEKLDKEYTLNARYQAFMGICYYHEWLYEEACQYLDKAIPQLEQFAPHERSVYYFTAGESHFQLQQYAQAIPYFEKALTVCYDNEKGDIHYRLGLCHMFAEQWQEAYNHYDTALDLFLALRDTPDMQARIHQTAHMMKGCEQHLKKDTETAAATQNDGKNEAQNELQNQLQNELQNQVKNEVQNELQNEQQNVLPTEFITRNITDAITLPSLVSPIDSMPLPPQRIDTSRILPEAASKGLRQEKDTIRREVPNTINIQDLYERQVEIKN